MIVGSIYVPKYAQYDTHIYDEHVTIIDELKAAYHDSPLCLFGDYNLLYIKWTNPHSLNFEVIGSFDKKIVNAIKDLLHWTLDTTPLYTL